MKMVTTQVPFQQCFILFTVNDSFVYTQYNYEIKIYMSSNNRMMVKEETWLSPLKSGQNQRYELLKDVELWPFFLFYLLFIIFLSFFLSFFLEKGGGERLALVFHFSNQQVISFGVAMSAKRISVLIKSLLSVKDSRALDRVFLLRGNKTLAVT